MENQREIVPFHGINITCLANQLYADYGYRLLVSTINSPIFKIIKWYKRLYCFDGGLMQWLTVIQAVQDKF